MDVRGLLPDSTEEIPPGAVLFLAPRNTVAHRIEPLDRLAAMERLANENVRPAEPHATDPAGAAFGALARLAAGCPCYALSVGPDLNSLHDRLVDLLSPDGRPRYGTA
jgi:hypothetical protein